MSILTAIAKISGFVSRKTRSYEEDIKLGGRRAARWIRRTTAPSPLVNNRNGIRHQAFVDCMVAVNKENPGMPRNERRALARAYSRRVWSDFRRERDLRNAVQV